MQNINSILLGLNDCYHHIFKSSPSEIGADLYFLCKRAFDSIQEFVEKPHTYTLITNLAAAGVVAYGVGYASLVPIVLLVIAVVSQYHKNHQRDLSRELEESRATALNLSQQMQENEALTETNRNLVTVINDLKETFSQQAGTVATGINSILTRLIENQSSTLSSYMEYRLMTPEQLAIIGNTIQKIHETHLMVGNIHGRLFPGGDVATTT